MAEVFITRKASENLQSIFNYISEDLQNPDAALSLIEEIKKSIVSLQAFLERYNPLDSITTIHSEYRYLLCKNYYIFYTMEDSNVVIASVLNRRQNIITNLFLD